MNDLPIVTQLVSGGIKVPPGLKIPKHIPLAQHCTASLNPQHASHGYQRTESDKGLCPGVSEFVGEIQVSNSGK